MREAIGEAYKTALKAGDKRRTATLRAVNAAIKDKDIANRGDGKGPLADEDVLVLLQKMVKQREEIAILTEFLPKSLSDTEVEEAIKAAIAKTGAAGAKDMGKVIASLKADYPGRIDFGRASGKVKAALG